MNSRRVAEIAAETPGANSVTLLERCLLDPHVFELEDIADCEVSELLSAVDNVVRSETYERAARRLASYRDRVAELADFRVSQLRAYARRRKLDRTLADTDETLAPDERAHLLMASALASDIDRQRRDGTSRGSREASQRRQRWPRSQAEPRSQAKPTPEREKVQFYPLAH